MSLVLPQHFIASITLQINILTFSNFLMKCSEYYIHYMKKLVHLSCQIVIEILNKINIHN